MSTPAMSAALPGTVGTTRRVPSAEGRTGRAATAEGTGRPRVLLLAFVAAYVAVGLLGRASVIDGTSLAPVWPAAGVSVLWFLLRGARLVSVDSVLLALAATGVMVATGGEPLITATLAATNVVQTVVAVTLLRRWRPELHGCGGSRPLDSPRALAGFSAGCAAGMAAGAALGTTLVALTGAEADWLTAALWFGRNLCGALVVASTGLLLAQRWAERPVRPVLDDAPGRVPELLAATAVAAGVYAATFALAELPVAFALLAVPVWFGTRFSVLVGALQALVAGAVTIGLTIHGVGPFAAVAAPTLSALLAQVYVVISTVVTLSLATSRAETRRLAAELRRTEQEAVYQAQLLDAVIGNIHVGIAVVDEAEHVEFSNAAAGELVAELGRRGTGPASAADLAGLLGADRGADRTEWPGARALRGETVRDLEVAVRDGEGERVLEVSAAPLPDDDGRARALVLFRDATSEHAHRTELAAFAGVVAHDLRNPLAALEGWTEVVEEALADGDADASLVSRFTARVRSSSTRMRDLIDDLLAHAESRDRDLKLRRIDLAALLRDLAAGRPGPGRVELGELPAVQADPVLLRQLLDNLVGNAFKYVAPGTVPEVRVTARPAPGGMVAVQVADNGIGLPPGEHDRVFTEFHRVHHGYEGNGLGLAICRRIVVRHGGSITARDDPSGTGTVFEFTLPAA